MRLSHARFGGVEIIDLVAENDEEIKALSRLGRPGAIVRAEVRHADISGGVALRFTVARGVPPGNIDG